MKKIAIDVREFENGKMTGIGRYLSVFLKNSHKYTRDFSYILLGDNKTKLPFPIPNNCIFEIYDYSPVLLWDQLAPLNSYKKHKFDIYFSPYPKRSFLPNCPSLITVNDMIPYFYPNKIFEKWLFMFSLKIYSKKTKIFTISEYSKITLQSFGFNDVFFAYPSLEDDKTICDKPIDFIESKKYLLSAGDMRKHKNMEFLLSAYQSFPEEFKKTFPLIVFGLSEKEIKKRYDNILLLGYLNDSQIKWLYKNALLFIFPSLSEGFGYPPLEAMKEGCPVLSSYKDPMPEILGDCVEYFDPNNKEDFKNKLLLLTRDLNKMKSLSEKGKKRAEFFTEEKFCEGLINIFTEAIRCAG
ncbi:MAG: glycosyltransferase family 1 protein [Elusimicrobiota bacterium]